jgi:hypothetical protein
MNLGLDGKVVLLTGAILPMDGGANPVIWSRSIA